MKLKSGNIHVVYFVFSTFSADKKEKTTKPAKTNSNITSENS